MYFCDTYKLVSTKFMRKLLYILIISLFAVCSCTNKKENTKISVIGFCCGECYGNCFQGFYIDKNKKIYKIEGNYCNEIDTINKVEIDYIKEQEVKNVINSLPLDYNDYEGIIGEPDSRDQCAVYLSYKKNNKTIEVIIDPDSGKHPKKFDEFVRKVLELRLL